MREGGKGTSSPRPPEVQTGFGREMPSPASYPMPPSSLLPAPSFSFSYDGTKSIGTLSFKSGLARLILRVLYLGEKSMSTDMLTRV